MGTSLTSFDYLLEITGTGWGGAENYVQLFDEITVDGQMLAATPYFLINVSGEGEGFSMWSPTPCDILATDWVEVND